MIKGNEQLDLNSVLLSDKQIRQKQNHMRRLYDSNRAQIANMQKRIDILSAENEALDEEIKRLEGIRP